MAFYVTTPIYYVNAAPHLGHAYTTIAADIIARHMRQRGEQVFFVTGTDEHGEPVALAAERAGISPKELADRNALRFKELLPKINVSTDAFIRTTDPRHIEKTQEILQRVYDNGYVYKGTYSGWYCPRCADFKTDAEIGPEQMCSIHKIKVDRAEEENWFFRLSAFQGELENLYKEGSTFVQPRQRFNEASSFIKGGLRDVSLSRERLTWGVPIPWDKDHVFYVWFDALLNYVSALSLAEEGSDQMDTFWPPNVQILGKDILKFHAVYWPALLMAAGLELPQRLLIHGYLLMRDSSGEEHKMSKSLGNVLDPFAAIDQFGADALRYYCFREVQFGQDGAVSTATFAERYESELANELGNLASRTLAMIRRYRDGEIPPVEPDNNLMNDFDGLAEKVSSLLDAVQITQALEEIWRMVRRLNRYVEEQAPWKMAKDPASASALDMTLKSLAEGLRVLTVLLHPYIPTSTVKLMNALGLSDPSSLKIEHAHFGDSLLGKSVGELEPLFPKEQ